MSFAKVALAIFRKSLRTMRFGASRSMFCLNHHKKRQDLFILFVAINSCMLMATCKFHRFQWKFQALGRKVLKALQLHEFQDHGLTMYSKVRVLLTCPKYSMPWNRWNDIGDPRPSSCQATNRTRGSLRHEEPWFTGFRPQNEEIDENRLPTSVEANWREKFCHNIFAAIFLHLSIPQMVHVEGKRNELAHTPVQNGYCTVSLYPGIPIPTHIIPQTAISCSWSFTATTARPTNNAEWCRIHGTGSYANEWQHMETDCAGSRGARLVTTRVLQLPQLQEPEGQHATENQPVECHGK